LAIAVQAAEQVHSGLSCSIGTRLRQTTHLLVALIMRDLRERATRAAQRSTSSS
jgi:hypothetical protein